MRTAVRGRQSGHEPSVGFGRVVQRPAQPEHGAARRRFLTGRQAPRNAADGHQNDANAWNEKNTQKPNQYKSPSSTILSNGELDMVVKFSLSF